MSPWLVSLLRCPEIGLRFERGPDCLRRADGKVFPDQDRIPSLVFPAALTGEDAKMNRFYEKLAPFYDWLERQGGKRIAGIDVEKAWQDVVSRLDLKPGLRLLEVSPGSGVYQPYLRAALGLEAEFASLDLSLGMLRQCRKRHASLRVELIQGNAQHLPFADESFDGLFHMGGINLFNEPDRAIAEFVRVVRKGGIVSWGDEQMSAHYRQQHPHRAKFLQRMNPGFLKTPPAIPTTLEKVTTHEVAGGLAYLVVGIKR
jgi:ubiquinone/menaquinone biosynthesis C-methylase UbiE